MARKKNRRAAPMSVQARYEFAVAYLNAMLEDAAPEELTAALGRIARAAGGPKLAEKVELSADSLYRTLCRRGNPELRSATVLLKAMGMRLVLERIPMAVARPGSTPVSPCPSGSRRRHSGLAGVPEGPAADGGGARNLRQVACRNA
ncbi:MAG TPA: addiction module antidote protein [Steroidobacteraceae bacterium]|nr:addiction module antidote protein [Steroidobacteraceae bacterium]